MNTKNQLALLILERLIETDDIGRPLKAKGSLGYIDLGEYLFQKEKIEFDDFSKLMKAMHRDCLINFEDANNPNEASIHLGERGLEYYKEKTREFH